MRAIMDEAPDCTRGVGVAAGAGTVLGAGDSMFGLPERREEIGVGLRKGSVAGINASHHGGGAGPHPGRGRWSRHRSGAGEPTFGLPDGNAEIGMGTHGEVGLDRAREGPPTRSMRACGGTVAEMAAPISSVASAGRLLGKSAPRSRGPSTPAGDVGQTAVGLCGTSARVNPWLRSTFATCGV